MRPDPPPTPQRLTRPTAEATTYVEVDSCELRADGTYYCHVTDEPKPVRLYGNAQLFPRTFDVAKTNIR